MGGIPIRIALSSKSHPVQSLIAQAAQSLGHEIVDNNPDVYIVRGWRKDHQALSYAHNCPVIVNEWGYFDRVNRNEEWRTGHWQLSIGGLNALPEGDFPSDRFDALGIELKQRERVEDGYVLVCGQLPNDAAVLGSDHREWIRDQIGHYESRGERVIFRPHPQDKENIDLDYFKDTLSGQLAGAKFVVCYNSNVGHDALIAGVPVVCDPCAAYSELSGERCPDIETRLKYFYRAAYGQWKCHEMKEGLKQTLSRIDYAGKNQELETGRAVAV